MLEDGFNHLLGIKSNKVKLCSSALTVGWKISPVDFSIMKILQETVIFRVHLVSP